MMVTSRLLSVINLDGKVCRLHFYSPCQTDLNFPVGGIWAAKEELNECSTHHGVASADGKPENFALESQKPMSKELNARRSLTGVRSSTPKYTRHDTECFMNVGGI